MNKFTKLILITALLTSTMTLFSKTQETLITKSKEIATISRIYETKVNNRDKERENSIFLRKWSIAGGVSILGIRFDVSTALNNHFNLRGGFCWTPSSMKFMKYEFSETIKAQDTYYTKYLSKADPIFKGSIDIITRQSHILIDFTPRKQGLFHITAGFFVGNITADLQGQIMDPESNKPLLDIIRDRTNVYGQYLVEGIKEIAVYEIKGLKVKFNEDDSVSTQIGIGKRVKPYVGVGIGRNISKYRFTFKLEAGVLNHGGLTLKSENSEGDLYNLLSKELDKAVDGITNKDHKDLAKILVPFAKKWCPIINVQLVFKFKN